MYDPFDLQALFDLALVRPPIQHQREESKRFSTFGKE